MAEGSGTLSEFVGQEKAAMEGGRRWGESGTVRLKLTEL